MWKMFWPTSLNRKEKSVDNYYEVVVYLFLLSQELIISLKLTYKS